MNILVIDIGTSSMRGLLFHDSFQLLMSTQICYSPRYMNDTIVEQPVSDWQNALLSICRTISEEAHSIDAISLTSQRSSVIPLSSDLKPLSDAIMWQDKRTIPICEALSPYADTVVRKSGSRINPVYTASKITWIRQMMPELYNKTQKFVVVPDYMFLLMTGQLTTDYTYGSRTLLMNIKTNTWDAELLDLWGVEKEKLPELSPPGRVVGKVRQDFARQTGIKAGTPVISAGGDQQCAALGQGVLRQGDIQIAAGTGAYVIGGYDSYIENQDDIILGSSAIPGKYVLESSILTCCSAFNWYHTNFYPDNDKDYALINSEISRSRAHSASPLVLPYFQGRATPLWNSGANASIHNITLSTTRGDIARSLLEGIGYEIKENLTVMERYLETRAVDAVLCGGLTKCGPFPSILAGIIGLPVRIYSNPESTSLGAFMSAMVCLGQCSSYEDAFSLAREKDSIDIREPEHTDVYENGNHEFRRTYLKLYP